MSYIAEMLHHQKLDLMVWIYHLKKKPLTSQHILDIVSNHSPAAVQLYLNTLSDFKNSFDSSKDAIIITGTPEQGQTLISQSGSDITISTCFEEGCDSSKFMKNDVSVE